MLGHMNTWRNPYKHPSVWAIPCIFKVSLRFHDKFWSGFERNSRWNSWNLLIFRGIPKSYLKVLLRIFFSESAFGNGSPCPSTITPMSAVGCPQHRFCSVCWLICDLLLWFIGKQRIFLDFSNNEEDKFKRLPNSDSVTSGSLRHCKKQLERTSPKVDRFRTPSPSSTPFN